VVLKTTQMANKNVFMTLFSRDVGEAGWLGGRQKLLENRNAKLEYDIGFEHPEQGQSA
jgi:hypothetical protein